MDSQTEELFKKMAEQFIKLIESNNYLLQENLRLMKLTNPMKIPEDKNTPTQGQVNYIKRLIGEGKIPATQSLDITKTEAQILIHNAINTPIRKEENHIAETIPNEMKEIDDY